MLQVFVMTGSSFARLQTLDFKEDIVSVTPFTRADVWYLAVCVDRPTSSCFLLQWTGGRFQNPQPLPVTGRVSQVEVVHTRAEDTLLLVFLKGGLPFSVFSTFHLWSNVLSVCTSKTTCLSRYLIQRLLQRVAEKGSCLDLIYGCVFAIMRCYFTLWFSVLSGSRRSGCMLAH